MSGASFEGRRKATVAVVDARDDVCAAVRAAMEAVRWREAVGAAAEVAVKPNLGWDLHLPGAVTSGAVVEGVVRVLRDTARRIYLVEADQVTVSCERALRQTGMDRVCREYGLEWVNLSRVPMAGVRVPAPLAEPELPIPELLTRIPLVSVPVLKTHGRTVLSGAVKNQWGCLPISRHRYHAALDEVLRDLCAVLRPRLCIVDATVALEGNGPKSGRPKVCDLVLAGADPVAVDAVASRVMGLDHLAIRHLDLCAAAGLGVRHPARIDVVDGRGQPLAPPVMAFEAARHNAVSWVETALRSSRAGRVVLEGPLFRLLCLATRVYYRAWYHGPAGRRLLRRLSRERAALQAPERASGMAAPPPEPMLRSAPPPPSLSEP
jgi:uncharacterized protein (DUF362 family)